MFILKGRVFQIIRSQDLGLLLPKLYLSRATRYRRHRGLGGGDLIPSTLKNNPDSASTIELKI